MTLLTNSSRVAATATDVLRRHIWLRPLIILLVMAAIGWWLRSKVETSLRENLHSVLETTLLAQRLAVQNWIRMQLNQSESAAGDAQIAATIGTLVDQAKPEVSALELFNLPSAQELRRELNPILDAHEYNGYVVVIPSGRVVASYRSELVGWQLPEVEMKPLREMAFAGHSMMLPPLPSKVALNAGNDF